LLKQLIRRKITKIRARKAGVDFGVFSARNQGVRVGNGCRVYTENFGSEPWLIEIGDKTTISSNVTFINHDGAAWLASDERGRRFRYARIVIGDRCFVGANVTLMPGIKIDHDCIVGAGAVVTKSIPSGTIVGGNPARTIGQTAAYIQRVLNDYRAADEMPSGGYRNKTTVSCDENFRPILNDSNNQKQS
jgi:acetyltransferase-like isoleucine patch superfamily enzyme